LKNAFFVFIHSYCSSKIYLDEHKLKRRGEAITPIKRPKLSPTFIINVDSAIASISKGLNVIEGVTVIGAP
jgi:hypothetical protein